VGAKCEGGDTFAQGEALSSDLIPGGGHLVERANRQGQTEKTRQGKSSTKGNKEERCKSAVTRYQNKGQGARITTTGEGRVGTKGSENKGFLGAKRGGTRPEAVQGGGTVVFSGLKRTGDDGKRWGTGSIYIQRDLRARGAF